MTASGQVSRGRSGDAARRPFVWLVAVIALVALVARVIEARATPLVFDEIYALLLARSGLAALLHTLSLDVEQPLHFVLMWLWRGAGGEAALWIKSLPIAFSVATVVVVAFAGRQMFGAAAGLLGALLLALHPTHLFYGQQATFHSMLWCLLTLEVWLGWRWVEHPNRRDGVLFVLTGAAALYTAYFSGFILAAIALWGALRLRREPRRVLAWLGLLVAVAAIFAPQLPTLAAQFRRDIIGEAHLAPLGAADIQEALRKLAFNMSYLTWPLLLLAAGLLVRRATRGPASLVWTVGLVTVLAPWALSVAGIHLFIVRQMLFNMGTACMIFAAGLIELGGLVRAPAASRGGVPRWAGGLAAAVVTLLVVRAAWLHQPHEEAVRLQQATDYLKAHARPGELVACAEPRALLFVRHELGDLDARLLIMPDAPVFHHSDGILIVPEAWKTTPEAFAAVRASGARWWGIRSRHAGRDGPEAAALLTAVAGGDSLAFGRVTVWVGGRASTGSPDTAAGAPPKPRSP